MNGPLFPGSSSSFGGRPWRYTRSLATGYSTLPDDVPKLAYDANSYPSTTDFNDM